LPVYLTHPNIRASTHHYLLCLDIRKSHEKIFPMEQPRTRYVAVCLSCSSFLFEADRLPRTLAVQCPDCGGRNTFQNSIQPVGYEPPHTLSSTFTRRFKRMFLNALFGVRARSDYIFGAWRTTAKTSEHNKSQTRILDFS
jgi:DNA-directed RNA polymerase subunit RPC12/RpoP